MAVSAVQGQGTATAWLRARRAAHQPAPSLLRLCTQLPSAVVLPMNERLASLAHPGQAMGVSSLQREVCSWLDLSASAAPLAADLHAYQRALVHGHVRCRALSAPTVEAVTRGAADRKGCCGQVLMANGTALHSWHLGDALCELLLALCCTRDAAANCSAALQPAVRV